MAAANRPDAIDLQMLAYDIADAIDRGGYPIDVSADDILPVLPEFLARIQQTDDQPGRRDT